ncbi:hypothetical protein [Pandoraea apista]|uniref:hypothetical protein n=1 Tax=Pandoraea apista TaxID=93218 RepID=UPI000F6660FC|nr:hypothetical protein [Pandoraea apista]RRW87967.1 hypothetical protein EGJ54_25075 [Pandoraea apista]RRW96725.1 hypothetical protein EGJ56_25015 [Pandoraea apista]
MKKVVIAASAATVAGAAILAGCISTSVTMPVQINAEHTSNEGETVRSEERAVQDTVTQEGKMRQVTEVQSEEATE